MVNEDVLKGKWREIKGEVQKTWGKLTDDELEKTKGDYGAIRGLVQQRYGEAREKYDDKLSDIFNRFGEKKDRAMEETKKILK